MSHTYVPAELRRLVRQRAGDRCEYCLIPEAVTFASHEVDHVIAEKHGGLTDQANLALSCAVWKVQT
jgi:5-methylcytosine-specific restriction endonuclease McrA